MSRRLRCVILTLVVMSFMGTATRAAVNTTPGGVDPYTTQNEPHIAAWGNVIVVGWNDSYNAPLPLGLRTAYGYSMDGGQTWTDAGPLPKPVLPNCTIVILCDLGRTEGDPVLGVDNAGTFYFATMAQDMFSSNYIAVGKRSALTTGVTFDAPVLVAGSDLAVLQDKPWLAVDATNSPYSGRVYLCWRDMADGSIRFVRSTSTTPLQFGIPQTSSYGIPGLPGTSYFGTSMVLSTSGKGCNIGIGPSGEIYVAWTTNMGSTPPATPQAIHVRKSTDGGDNFGIDVTVAQPARSGDEGSSADCGKRALGGHIRIPDWPLVAVDRSGGQYNGTVYITFNAAGGGADHADVFVVRSPASLAALGSGDPGATWSAPVAINKTPAAVEGEDPTSNDNWMPAIAVGSNGTVAVSYYDRRTDPSNMNINMFIAMSTDRGSTWKNQQVTAAPFGVPQLWPTNFNSLTDVCYMGDYNGMAAVEGNFHLVWGDNSNLVQGRPDPDIAYKSKMALCAFVNPISGCDGVDGTRLFREGMTIRFRDRFRTWIDPIEQNCFYKWFCPPCTAGPGGLCASTYVITFDFAKARLDPGVVAIRLLDFQGREITPPRTVGGRTVFSFRPRGFRAGGAREQMFFAFALGPRGRVGTDYRIPVRLDVKP